METIRCPNCGKEIEIDVLPTPSLGIVGYEIECPECGYTGEDLYEVDEEGDEDIFF